jgi:hypothetical protein
MLYADHGYWIGHVLSRTKEALGRAYRSGGGMTKRRRSMAALLSASALVLLDAACPLYVLGGSGERREARGRERHAPGAPGSEGPDQRGRRSPFVLVPRRPS